MNKQWARWISFGVARWDWCLFGLTALGLGLWASWCLSPQPTGPRLRLVWQYDQPPQEFTIPELRAATGAMRITCHELESEVARLRGIRPGSPAAKQLQALLGEAIRPFEMEKYIRYEFNQRRNPAAPYDPFFAPFTERQKRIIQFSEDLEVAYNLKRQERQLTALVAVSRRPTPLEGLYCDFRDMEVLVARTAAGYQVRIGGSYGSYPHAYEYEFTATRNGDVLTGEARLQPEHLSEKPVTIVIRFDRGIIEVSDRTMFSRRTLVKLADLRHPSQPLNGMVPLGPGPCSNDQWTAREEFLQADVAWTSSVRPGFSLMLAPSFYEVCDEALGGPRQER